MRRVFVFTRPTKVSLTSFMDFYDEISDGWEQKAQALQERRWRAIRNK